MTKKVIKIHFKSVEDFKSRICRLWQNQEEDEEYEFTFENDEVEKAFNELMTKFG
jgi:hypothetical protein